ncbi:MAG: beta-agarase, partial [Kiritimatiellaeota bacterium]|nr:beta-agarase [Kiritimatiellota bacterium]
MHLRKLFLGLAFGGALAAGAEEPVTLVTDFSKPENRARISANEATLSPATSEVLRVTTRAKASWPGVTVRPAQDSWDFSNAQRLLVHIRNPGDEPLEMHVRVDDAKRDQAAHGSGSVAPHSTGTVDVRLNALPFRLTHPLKLISMRGAPGTGEELDTARIKRLFIFIAKPKKSHQFELLRIETANIGVIPTLDADKFLPFVDEFGQFKHGDWPGKLHGAGEFSERMQAEDADLAAHPAPGDRDAYGGWAAGPKLEATGYFRTAKHDGRWWLVDPDGRLFWSQGMDCVRASMETPLTDRTNYFAWLPPRSGEFGQFYAKRGRASVGYYKDLSRNEAFNFVGANLLRKYGAQWNELDVDRAHRRLASWGYNTVGNWSEWSVVSKRRTPYVGTVSAWSPVIAGSHGYWGQFPDPFHPDFAPALRKALEKDKSVGEKWCLGVFIHNELAWGSETSLAEAALQSSADQPAKKEF